MSKLSVNELTDETWSGTGSTIPLSPSFDRPGQTETKDVVELGKGLEEVSG